MRIPVKFIDMKAPLFMEGKSFGSKVGNSEDHKKWLKTGELTMLFDDRMNSIIVTYKGGAAVVHVSATLSWSPVNSADVAEKEKKKVAPTATNVLTTQAQQEKLSEQ